MNLFFVLFSTVFFVASSCFAPNSPQTPRDQKISNNSQPRAPKKTRTFYQSADYRACVQNLSSVAGSLLPIFNEMQANQQSRL